MPERLFQKAAVGLVANTLQKGSSGAYLGARVLGRAGPAQEGGLPALVRNSGRFARLRTALVLLVQTGRLMVGVPDYGNYVRHMRERHPGVSPMTRDAFHRYCVEARYPGRNRPGGARCPC